MRACRAVLVAACLLGSATSSLTAQGSAASDDRPNFLLIVADDMGMSDMGAFGGEIPTPSLDALAERGVRYTQFYVSPTCSPTRAMLLSGTDNHRAGLGNMIERLAFNQEGQPGYEGVLNQRVAPLPAILREAGYHTYMTGKWHLGKDPEHIPAARGFERDFSMLAAAGSYFDMTGNNWEVPDNQFTGDGEYLDRLPRGYYATKTYTDKMIEFIESGRDDGRPFFAYLAHQAPHDPLQVPNDWLRRHRGRYDCGWDSVRVHRLNRMTELGILDGDADLAPRLWFVPKFNALTGIARYATARKMEIYASVVEYLDAEIGRILAYLDETGQLDNTYVIFFSDNGPESRDAVAAAQNRPSSQAAGWLANDYDTDFASWGRKGSHLGYGQPWAQVSATPFWMFKGMLYEGGIRSPLIVVPPGGRGTSAAGTVNREALLHVMDIAPTLLEMAGVDAPTTFDGREVLPMQGISWAPMIDGRTASPRGSEDWLGFELWGMRAVRKGPWKLLWMHEPFGNERWQLFDVTRDPAEQVDLAPSRPEIVAEMVGHWDAYVAENNVILPDRHQFEGMADQLPPRPAVLGSWPPGSEENYGEPEDDEYFTCSVKAK